MADRISDWQTAKELIPNHLQVLLYALDTKERGKKISNHVFRFVGELADADDVDAYVEVDGHEHYTMRTLSKVGFTERARSPIVC